MSPQMYSIHFIFSWFIVNISNSQPTSTPIVSSPTKSPTLSFKTADNLYGPEGFTTLDWILSGCILAILCGITIFCYLCIKRRIKQKTPSSEISVKSGINQSEMTTTYHTKSPSNNTTRPKVSQSFGYAHELPQKNTLAFDAVVAGVALSKQEENTANIKTDFNDVETPVDNEPQQNYDDHEYGSYGHGVDANRYGYSPLSQQELETEPQPEPQTIIPSPKSKPPTVPPQVPISILNELNVAVQNVVNVDDDNAYGEYEYEYDEQMDEYNDNNKEESSSSSSRENVETQIEYLSIEEAKLLKGVDKEKRLNDDDFMLVFGMTKDKFYKLPGWKQKNFKKSNGFF